jgi:hypothetical protein
MHVNRLFLDSHRLHEYVQYGMCERICAAVAATDDAYPDLSMGQLVARRGE